MKISSVKERKKKRESARERSIGFVMSFARVLDELFIRCLLLLVVVVLVLFRDSLKIRFFFLFHRCWKNDSDEERGCEQRKMPSRRWGTINFHGDGQWRRDDARDDDDDDGRTMRRHRWSSSGSTWIAQLVVGRRWTGGGTEMRK